MNAKRSPNFRARWITTAAALEVMAGSNAYSEAMDLKGRKMVERDFTVEARLSQHLKEVYLMLEAAAAAGISLPLYLPELFPTHVRAAGSGIAYNVGRFATAVGVFVAGVLFSILGGSYPRVGSLCGLIYALGLIVIWWAPDTSSHKLHE